MNKTLRNSMKAAMGGLVLLAGNAMADPTTASLTDADGDNASGGGAWLMDVFDENGVKVFDDILTFCVELSESIRIDGTLYQIDSIESYATEGGGGAVNGKDPMDVRTAWLYEQIISGVTTYGSASYNNVKDAYDDAQYAFWVLEDEMDISGVTNPSNVNAMIGAAQTAVGTGNYAGTNVVLYNLATVNNDGSLTQRQSMLGWKDDTGGQEPIPEPAILLMLGGGLLGMAGLRRRRRFH